MRQDSSNHTIRRFWYQVAGTKRSFVNRPARITEAAYGVLCVFLLALFHEEHPLEFLLYSSGQIQERNAYAGPKDCDFPGSLPIQQAVQPVFFQKIDRFIRIACTPMDHISVMLQSIIRAIYVVIARASAENICFEFCAMHVKTHRH